MATSGTINSTMTAQEIVTAAMVELAVISAGEQPTAEEGEVGLQRLNWMLKSWQAKGLNLWREAQFSVTFPASTATMTLDPRVVDVAEARLVQSSAFERPLQRWENGQYRSIPNKATPGFPAAFTLTKGVDSIDMTLWPVPVEEMDVFYTGARVIEDVTELTQTLDVPQMWLQTVWLCLARDLLSIYGVTRIDPAAATLIVQRAAELEQQMLDYDRPASVFLGPVYGRYF